VSGTYDVIDFHTHAFPDASTGVTWQKLLGRFEIKRSGDLGELTGLMAQAGIDRSVVLLFPRSKERYARLVAQGVDAREAGRSIVKEIIALNRWGCEVACSDPRFLAFAGVNPRFMAADELRREICEAHSAGASGVKIIPPALEMYANDRLLWPVYEECSRLGLVLLSQSGSGGGPPPAPGADHYGRPKYHAEVLAAFPRLKLVLAHLGLGYEEDVVDLVQRFPNVYTDTSLRLSRLDTPEGWATGDLVKLIRRIGVERVLFGTNFPMTHPAAYVSRMRSMPFTDGERERILSGNARELLGTG
jgi:predicted TIM-barrel fold metal-dependent hydrolase